VLPSLYPPCTAPGAGAGITAESAPLRTPIKFLIDKLEMCTGVDAWNLA